MSTKSEVKAVERQLARPWPLMSTEGIVTTGGRTFHRDETCPGYVRGCDEAVKRGRRLGLVERVTARKAKSRGKAACSFCWGQP